MGVNKTLLIQHEHCTSEGAVQQLAAYLLAALLCQ